MQPDEFGPRGDAEELTDEEIAEKKKIVEEGQ